MGFLAKLRGLVRYALGTVEKPDLLAVGSPAPEFEVEDHLGAKVRLRDLRGKRVVLWFYPKAATPG
jgi:peroxiredoxin